MSERFKHVAERMRGRRLAGLIHQARNYYGQRNFDTLLPPPVVEPPSNPNRLFPVERILLTLAACGFLATVATPSVGTELKLSAQQISLLMLAEGGTTLLSILAFAGHAAVHPRD